MATELPRRLYTAAEVRALDARAIEGHGIPGAVLMERAGASVLRALRARWPDARRLSIVTGTGNNGGDGFVVARLAAAAGLEARVGLLGDRTRSRGDAAQMRSRMEAAGVHAVAFEPGCLIGADVVVDALLGTGISRPPSGAWVEAIEAMNRAQAPTVAVDLPSGLSADSGAAPGAAVRAALTVTFIGLKRGLLTGEGPALCGELRFEDLSVPEAIYHEVDASAERIDRGLLAVLGRRRRTAHKGTHGHVLVVGGDLGFTGAVRLAGEAAARAGAGLVSVATRPEHAAVLALARPELMCRGVVDEEGLAALAERADVVALGPGLGQGAWGERMWTAALGLGLPTVLDADGLNALARAPRSRSDWVLTPHPAEAGRLLGCRTAEIQADRFAAAQAIARRFGGICVLKGAGTLVARAGAVPRICSDGNPGLATGGSGDVLTGVIAGLAAQGHPLEAAAALGVCAHAAAGDLAALAGERGMLAGDVIDHLRVVVNPP